VLAREKANSRLSHPGVIAHTSATNAGNNHSFSVLKVDDSILTRQKRQRDMGQYEAMKYFDKEVNKKFTWSVVFDVKAGGYQLSNAMISYDTIHPSEMGGLCFPWFTCWQLE
jgi:hypothetical protein